MSLFFVSALVAIFFSQVTQTYSTKDFIKKSSPAHIARLQGPKGEPGMKGDRGQCNDCREKIKRLERKLVALENNYHRNCDDLYQAGVTLDGYYNIEVNGQVMEIFCEFQKNGGNWMIFQRRFSGEVDFYRKWNDYVKGFGQKYGEFWLGLEDLHSILRTGRHMLRVDIEDWEGNTAYAEYRTFSIGGESTNFRSTFQGYRGNAGDSLSYHNNRQFSTKDRDNDAHYTRHCSTTHLGAWWYNECHTANLNGKYMGYGTTDDNRGMTWWHWKKSHYSLKKSEMKIRPVRR